MGEKMRKQGRGGSRGEGLWRHALQGTPFDKSNSLQAQLDQSIVF
jgi:hypothetical protein